MNPVRTALGEQGYGAYEVEWQGSRPVLKATDKPPDGLLIPGFVDVHIHGAFGIDFMSATRTEMDTLCTRLAEVGYEFFLPTTVTAPLSGVLSALSNLPSSPMVPGFHLEGPFLSPKHPGAQPPEWIKTPQEGLDSWQEVLADPRLKLVTLAPEEPGGNDLTSFLAERGVRVSLGHTDASYDQAKTAFEHGARQLTHTFNAMRGLHHREPGCVGFGMSVPGMYTELIYDRHHVSKPAAQILEKCVGPDFLIAVSDSSAATGLPDGERLSMWGHDCHISNGTVRLVANDALAGSAVTLFDCFRNLAEDLSPEVAIRSCCINPRESIGLPAPGDVWIDLDPHLGIRRVYRSSDEAGRP